MSCTVPMTPDELRGLTREQGLPELPCGMYVRTIEIGHDREHFHYYTAEQMHAYALAAIERAQVEASKSQVKRIAALSTAALPKEPPPGLLMSMALRLDHSLAVPADCLPIKPPREERLRQALADARRCYEEVCGTGFYKPEREAVYAAMLSPPPQDTQGGSHA